MITTIAKKETVINWPNMTQRCSVPKYKDAKIRNCDLNLIGK
jgi:hypothetical protein